jgi:16S rRNA (uracil1498-N3)-methyltransferase
MLELRCDQRILRIIYYYCVIMDYFYCPPEDIQATFLEIREEEFSHLVHVMRKKEGDDIRVVDGRGNAYDVRLEEIKKKVARAVIQKTYHNYHEPSIHVTLAVGILKNPSKFDFLVEKVTELGVKEIIPLRTERTISDHAKAERWQKLALAAMKQSGRSYLPIVRELSSIAELFADGRTIDHRYISHEVQSGNNSIPDDFPKTNQTILILVGPEGGFSESEVARAVVAGYEQLYLGERRLRTETAAIALATMVLLEHKP